MMMSLVRTRPALLMKPNARVGFEWTASLNLSNQFGNCTCSVEMFCLNMSVLFKMLLKKHRNDEIHM